MLKKRWYILPISGLFLLGFILGSFLDLKINQAIYDSTNWFGYFMAAFGETPFYASMGIFGFGFYYLFKRYTHKGIKFLLVLGIISSAFVCIYFQGKHIFDANAFNNSKLLWLGFLIAIVIYVGGLVAGYFIFKNTDVAPNRLLLILLVLVVACGLAIGFNQILKSIMARPRYRFLYRQDLVSEFRNWWENGRDLKKDWVGLSWNDMSGVITKEEFKSFPSGHMSDTVMMIAILGALPLLNDKIKIKQEYFVIGACVWNVLLAYSRMRMGAHYLSDVSFGSLIALAMIAIANEVYIKLDHKFFPKKEEIEHVQE